MEHTQHTGMELVQALHEGTVQRPPMADLLPFELQPPILGQITLTASPTDDFHNLVGTVHGGWIMTMLDTAMALAAQTTLAAGEACMSHETSAKFVKPVRSNAGPVTITGRVISRGRSLITLDGQVQDQNGKLLAHGTSTCVVMAV
ncbi:PaaI family thioesterase [Rhizobium sp. TH135]|uniref:PaaI family thioesterase n=1 Tax=Rhizobium sp. TH135 TaxID=2067451 RepID=UPI001FDFF8A6|nr:PaaI family thioesterase [Rhizobium sp. TH135]